MQTAKERFDEWVKEYRTYHKTDDVDTVAWYAFWEGINFASELGITRADDNEIASPQTGAKIKE